MQKMVNGIAVDLTADEIAQRQAEESDWTAKQWVTQKSAMFTEVRTYREGVLNRLMGIALAADVAGDAVTRDGCLSARRSLLDITKDPRVIDATTLEVLEMAIKTRYAEIAAAAPAAVRTAFAAGNV